MIFQIPRRSGDRVGLEVFRRADHCEAQVRGDTNGNHISLDELTDLYASIVPPGYEIDRVVRGGHL
jgi:hypothetical protein